MSLDLQGCCVVQVVNGSYVELVLQDLQKACQRFVCVLTFLSVLFANKPHPMSDCNFAILFVAHLASLPSLYRPPLAKSDPSTALHGGLPESVSLYCRKKLLCLQATPMRVRAMRVVRMPRVQLLLKLRRKLTVKVPRLLLQLRAHPAPKLKAFRMPGQRQEKFLRTRCCRPKCCCSCLCA